MAADDTVCALAARPSDPLPSTELERRQTPPDDVTAQRLLGGIWDGHAYEMSGELGAPGVTAEVGEPAAVCFEQGGRFTLRRGGDAADRLAAGCVPRSRTYTVRREPETDALMLDVTITGGCPDDAGFDRPYHGLSEVRRLDDRVLVLMDASTGAVGGYRRR